MIVVTVQLYSAITHKVTTLARTIIHNTRTSETGQYGDYEVFVGHKTHVEDFDKIIASPVRKGTVTEYPRLRYNVWRLVIRALRSAFPEEDRRPRAALVQAEDLDALHIDQMLDQFIAMTADPDKALEDNPPWDITLYDRLCKALLIQALNEKKDRA